MTSPNCSNDLLLRDEIQQGDGSACEQMVQEHDVLNAQEQVGAEPLRSGYFWAQHCNVQSASPRGYSRLMPPRDCHLVGWQEYHVFLLQALALCHGSDEKKNVEPRPPTMARHHPLPFQPMEMLVIDLRGSVQAVEDLQTGPILSRERRAGDRAVIVLLADRVRCSSRTGHTYRLRTCMPGLSSSAYPSPRSLDMDSSGKHHPYLVGKLTLQRPKARKSASWTLSPATARRRDQLTSFQPRSVSYDSKAGAHLSTEPCFRQGPLS